MGVDKAIDSNLKHSQYLADTRNIHNAMVILDDAQKIFQTGWSMPNIGKDDPNAEKRGNETLNSLN